jgi:NAD(P)-dependent dehydrogenase (short-subunit alcohol dehydrogenase family)
VSTALRGAGAIVTGGGRGIGAAVAKLLTARGARVTVFARTQAELDVVVKAGDAQLAVAGDVSNAADVERLFARHTEALGACDVLVNNAAILEVEPIESLSVERWRRVLDVNLTGAFLCARAAIPGMKARRTGRIINVSSISGTLGTPKLSAYNCSKWGLLGLTKCLAEELRPLGITCLSVSPGSTDTAMLAKTDFKPFMKPEDVAGIVAWCAGDAPSAMTGSNVEAFG